MTDKKEEKVVKKEPKPKKESNKKKEIQGEPEGLTEGVAELGQAVPDIVVMEREGDHHREEETSREHVTSLDLLWKHAFGELDEWAKRAEHRDEMFMNAARNYTESIKRKQENLRAVTEQFKKELSEWEKAARDELLMSTTSFQHFFPKRSYEEINETIDHIYKRTLGILSAPCEAAGNHPSADNYLRLIEDYVSLRKKARVQYVKTVKQTAGLLYESQKGFVDIFTRQIKSVILPFNKYLEKE